MNIGEVLELLSSDFPSISIPKIRFLEEQGYVTPVRTPAGYRKFTHADVERLRYVLVLQRDYEQSHKRIAEILAPAFRALELTVLQRLNARIAVEGQPARDVARAHLAAAGLLR